MTDIKLEIKNLEMDFTITDELLSRWVEMVKTSKPTSEKKKERKEKLDSSEVQEEVDQPTCTEEELRSVLGKVIKKLGRDAVVKVMKPFGGKLDRVKEDKYPEIMASAKEALGD